MVVERVGPADVLALRHAVLRPHQPPEEAAYPADVVPGAFHVAARDQPGGTVVGVATIAPEPHPRDPAPGDWRVRGMATAPSVRGRGYGAPLLAACLEHAAAQGGRRAWCNARTPAVGFYERMGFVVETEVFELPAIGPHVVMSRRLER